MPTGKCKYKEKRIKYQKIRKMLPLRPPNSNLRQLNDSEVYFFFLYLYIFKNLQTTSIHQSFVRQTQGTISQFFQHELCPNQCAVWPFPTIRLCSFFAPVRYKYQSITEPTRFDFYSKNRPVAESLCLQLHLCLLQLFTLLFVLSQKGRQLAALVVIAPLQRRHLLLESADLLLLRLQLCLSVQGLWSHVERMIFFVNPIVLTK